MREANSQSGRPPQFTDKNGTHDLASISVLESEILKCLWDAGEPQSVVQVLDSFYTTRKPEQRAKLSPSTIAVTISHMTQKGLLTMQRPPGRTSGGRGRGKGYYVPTVTRAEVTAAMLDAASRRLTGQPLGYWLSCLNDTQSHAAAEASAPEAGFAAVITALKDLRQPSSTT